MAFVTVPDHAESGYSIWISDNGDDSVLLDALKQVLSAKAKSLMILACSANDHSPSELADFLHACPVPICGGVFPAVFYGSTKLDVGFVILGFPFLISVSCYQQLSVSSRHWAELHLQDVEAAKQARDLCVFVDAAAATAEEFIDALYENIGGGIDVIGGGAGSLDFKSRPCIFSCEGLLADAALVVQLPIAIHCASDHGWQVLSGPYLVTEAEGVKVKTLNYMPAFEVYRNLLEEITDYRFTADNFFEVSQNFPLGIVGINNEILVRDPVRAVNNELICVGRIPVNSMIYILCAKPDGIIRAAELTGLLSAEKNHNLKIAKTRLVLVFDCVSRALYLGKDFVQELEAVQRGVGHGQFLVGVLSIGEIANTSQGTINLLNKSIVVGNL